MGMAAHSSAEEANDGAVRAAVFGDLKLLPAGSLFSISM